MNLHKPENGDNNDSDPSNDPEHINDEGEEEEEIMEQDMEQIIELPDQPEISDELAEEIDEMEMGGDDNEIDDGSAPVDMSKHIIRQHTDSVFCVNIDGSGQLIGSGGEDDKAYIYENKDNTQVLLQCTGFKDSVTCLEFSSDSRYVAVGDMSGLIKVWRMDRLSEVWSSDEVGDLEWLCWHHSAHVLLAGTSSGDVWMWKIPSGEMKTMQGHGERATAGSIMHDGKHVCVGYEDGSVKIWDLKTCQSKHHIAGHAGHTAPVTVVSCHTKSPTVATGSVDCTTKLINTNTGKVLTTYNCASAQQPQQGVPSAGNSSEGEGAEASEEGDSLENSIEAVGFCNSHNLLACGTLKGELLIWNTKTHTLRHRCIHQAGITRLQWHSTEALVLTSTLDGVVHLWDARNGKELKTWTGHQSEILDMVLSKDNHWIVTCSGDHTIRVFDTQVLAS